MSDDLSNIKQRITTLTLQSVGVDAEDKMIDIEKQAYVNSGIVQCANDVFKAIDITDKYVKGLKNKASIETFVQHLCKQITLVRDNAHSKYNECNGKIMAYQDIINLVTKKINDLKIKSESSNVGTRPDEREDIRERKKGIKGE